MMKIGIGSAVAALAILGASIALESSAAEQTTIDFNNYTALPYDKAVAGYHTISANGTQISIAGTAGMKFAIPYTVTADTILEFEFRFDGATPIWMNMGFATEDGGPSGNWDTASMFSLAGNPGDFIDDYIVTQKNTWHTFSIPAGAHFQGDFPYFAFMVWTDIITDPNATCHFRNIVIREPGRTITIWADLSDLIWSSDPVAPDKSVEDNATIFAGLDPTADVVLTATSEQADG